MRKDIVFTTETDGLVKHTLVNDKFIHLFPNMLDISLRVQGAKESLNVLVDNGIDIPKEVTKINGITNEDVEQYGASPEKVSELLEKVINDGDALITHNAKFHSKVLEAFYFRIGKKMPDVQFICLQSLCTDLLRIVSDFEGEYKYPSLKELRSYYNIPNEASKMDSLVLIYDLVKEQLNERRDQEGKEEEIAEGSKSSSS